MEESGSRLTIGFTTIYPKPLPRINIDIASDELGFTLIEKRALKQAWRVLEPFSRRFGKDIFYTFLTKYELEIETFRCDDVLRLERLHWHARGMINFIGALITVGLDDPPSFNMMVSEQNSAHSNVQMESNSLLAESMRDYLLKVLEPQSSQTLQVAFQKLFDKVTVHPQRSNNKLFSNSSTMLVEDELRESSKSNHVNITHTQRTIDV